MTVGTSNFGELLWPGIKALYGDTYDQWPALYSQIFEEMESRLAFEKFQGVTSFGLAAVKDQGTAATYADPFLGFQKIIDPVVYSLGSSVTIEMYEDDQYNFIGKIPAMLAESIRHTEETVAFDVFNRAFNASFPGADGVPLASTAHPLVEGGTYSNRPTVAADLTQTSLENACIAISQFVDDRNKKIGLKAIRLIVSTDDQYKAEKILNTQYKVDSADNTINPMMGKMPLVVVPYVTDADAWFVQTNCKEGFIRTMRRKAKLERMNEFDTQNLKFLTTIRFGISWVNSRCVYASPGA